MSNFNNGNVNLAGGCGVNNVPAVGVYNLSPQCPNTGFGANSFASQTQALKFGLTQPVPFLTISSSTATQRLVFGFDASCSAFISAETGFAVDSLVDVFTTASTTNRSALALECFLEHRIAVLGLIVNPTTDLSALSGTMVIADPCAPCYSSDVQFQSAGNCNGSCSFVASNIPVGSNNFFVLSLPAGTGATIQICDCTIETPSFSGCPTAAPVVASVPTGSFCPPAYVNAPVLGGANGAAIYTGANRGF